MKKQILLILCLCGILTYSYVYSQNKTSSYPKISKNDKSFIYNEDNSTNIYKYKDELISEIKKENESLYRESKYLREELNKVKSQLNYNEDNKNVKFFTHTIRFAANKRYHSIFRENHWKNGTEFKVEGQTYLNGIGFDRTENKNKSYYFAKLYNEDLKYSKLTGYIGIDDLAENLSDSEVTFSVFNNDNIIKCNNEFFGEEIYKTKFKKSDGLKKIDINLKEAKNIIIEFSVDKESDLNYFLMLDPKLQ